MKPNSPMTTSKIILTASPAQKAKYTAAAQASEHKTLNNWFIALAENETQQNPPPPPKWMKSFSERTATILVKAGITKQQQLIDIISSPEGTAYLKTLPNFGQRTLTELNDWLITKN